MHILVVNDDGPPSKRLSPYIRPFVNALQDAGHLVSVAIPAASRSWIGKAHLIEASLKATYVPPSAFRDDGTWDETFDSAETETPQPEWVVIRNGTPASCVQLGLFNLFQDRPPFDLVISGPNHGRNASTVYNLSSGTVGGALEAATCSKRAIAISFGSKDPQPDDIISAAARHAVKVVNYLYEHWHADVELYNLNVPMREDVESRPVRWTEALPYYWPRGCMYGEVTAGKKVNGHTEPAVNGSSGSHLKEIDFTWAAELSEMKKTLQSSREGTDAHTVLNGDTSVTALRANFWHVPDLEGPINLDD
ncbi:survival protein sure-like phosphatase/nucleotidase [Aspergillus tamarii]|uniref:Survival protein sure-like phosphatase/nucleotidase n=1 Tax=Aspergillus tamarii TaxID=41984 RepID=A0A5N6UXV8_ASPTM|nr:survival protein sure-like phosphatase/nucleotidase [Aspergillus tamarii]